MRRGGGGSGTRTGTNKQRTAAATASAAAAADAPALAPAPAPAQVPPPWLEVPPALQHFGAEAWNRRAEDMTLIAAVGRNPDACRHLVPWSLGTALLCIKVFTN